MRQPVEAVVFQNYFTPYRRALFEQVGARIGLTVLHSQRPEDGGRRWQEEPASTYRTIQARTLKLGPLVFFAMPWTLLKRARGMIVVLHDDNAANLAMILWGAILRLMGARTLLWVEHVPVARGGLKLLYQQICSRLLIGLSDEVMAFSELSETYVRKLRPRARVSRMLQSVPQPPSIAARHKGAVQSFGFMGSDHPRKNLDALIEAFADLDDNVQLHVAGVPPREDGDPRIRYWGYVDGAEREHFFSAIDMFVLPSLREPWGLVVNEALDRGALAMVSSACGSRELVARIDPALVFEPDAFHITAALRYALTLDVSAMSAAIDEAASAYSTPAAATRLVEIIADVH